MLAVRIISLSRRAVLQSRAVRGALTLLSLLRVNSIHAGRRSPAQSLFKFYSQYFEHIG